MDDCKPVLPTSEIGASEERQVLRSVTTNWRKAIRNKKKANATKASRIIDGTIAMPKHDFLYPVGVTYEQAAFGIDIDGKKQRMHDDFMGMQPELVPSETAAMVKLVRQLRRVQKVLKVNNAEMAKLTATGAPIPQRLQGRLMDKMDATHQGY
jgi:hypothetical protein